MRKRPVGLERVDVRAVGREEARCRTSPPRARARAGCTGVKPALREVVERELVEGHRDARGVADDVAEARARHARGALHVEAADLRVLARLGERRAARRRDGAPRRRPPCRRREPTRRGGFGTSASAASRAASAAASSSSASLSAAFTGRSASSSSGVGLPLSFVRPRSSSTFGMSSRQRSSASSSASNSSAAPLRASAARQPSGSLRAALRSITTWSLERRAGYLPATDETYAATSAICWR